MKPPETLVLSPAAPVREATAAAVAEIAPDVIAATACARRLYPHRQVPTENMSTVAEKLKAGGHCAGLIGNSLVGKCVTCSEKFNSNYGRLTYSSSSSPCPLSESPTE